MQRIWAPWRKTYIRPHPNKSKKCVFCAMLKARQDARNYILKRSRTCFAVLNLYPYNNGHVLILPNRHVPSIESLSQAEQLEWLALAEEVRKGLEKAVRPHGFNLGINLGRTAGAGIPGHLHLHIVPRWQGDANFMPVVGGTKVISESLDSLYRCLTPHLKPAKKAGSKR